MIGHRLTQRCRLFSILVLAMALAPVTAESQEDRYGFAGCFSHAGKAPNVVLGAPGGMGVSLRPDLQTIKACGDFCKGRTRTAPDKVDWRVEPAFKPPYRYATLTGGGWCLCDNEIGGSRVADGVCLKKMNCLKTPEKKCYVPQPELMVVDLDPPPGTAATGGGGTTTTTGGGGTATPGGGGAPPTQPPAPGANRRPNPPTVQPGGWDPPFPLQYEGAYQMSWQDNGDPDGDVLTFGVIIFQYDWTGRRWMQMPGIRDQYGTYGMAWLPEDNYTFTTQNGLSPRTHYAWMVFACDLGKGPAALCSWSGWGLFRTQ